MLGRNFIFYFEPHFLGDFSAPPQVAAAHFWFAAGDASPTAHAVKLIVAKIRTELKSIAFIFYPF
jgi:hypothetical protein